MTIHWIEPASARVAQNDAPAAPAPPPAARVEGLARLGELGRLGEFGHLGELGRLGELAKIGQFAQLSAAQEKELENAIETAVQEALRAAAAAREGNTEAAVLARERAQAAVDAVRAELEASRAGAQAVVAQPPLFPPDMIPPQAVEIAIAFFGMIAFIAVGVPLARAFGRRVDRRSAAAMPPDLGPRLDRLEQAVEAVAIEVERISEGQRYATKVMSELRGLSASHPDAWPGKGAREAEPVPRSGESR